MKSLTIIHQSSFPSCSDLSLYSNSQRTDEKENNAEKEIKSEFPYVIAYTEHNLELWLQNTALYCQKIVSVIYTSSTVRLNLWRTRRSQELEQI